MTRGARTTCILSFWLALLGPATARPAINTITTLAEDDVANGNCTLREALRASIVEAAVDQCAGDVGPDTIVLEAIGAYELDDGNLDLFARQLVVRGDGDHARGDYVVDLQGAQRFLSAREGSDLTIENLTLADGFSSDSGGAVSAEGSDLALRGVRITASRAARGGAIGFLAATSQIVDLLDVELDGNVASEPLADPFRRGGALVIDVGSASTVRLAGVRFVQNQISDSQIGTTGAGGGAAISTGGAVAVTIRESTFESNLVRTGSSALGGGLFVDHDSTGPLELTDLIFTDNDFPGPSNLQVGTASYVVLGRSTAVVRRIRAIGNGPTIPSQQVYLNSRFPVELLLSDLLIARGGGTGLVLGCSTPGATCLAGHLTVTDHAGTGLHLFEGAQGSTRVENSIVFDNGQVAGTEIEVGGGSPEISAECLIGTDPEFENADAGDYRLAQGSAAVDAGDAKFAAVGPWDAAHGARVVGDDTDLGAFERGALFADDFESGDLFAWNGAL